MLSFLGNGYQLKKYMSFFTQMYPNDQSGEDSEEKNVLTSRLKNLGIGKHAFEESRTACNVNLDSQKHDKVFGK